MAEQIRIPLRLEATVDVMDRLAWTEDWALQNVVQPSDQSPYEAVWAAEDGTEIHFFDDHLVDMPYVVVAGPGAAPLAARLRGLLPVVEAADVLEMERGAATPEERIYAVLYAGVVADAGTPAEVLEVVARGGASDDPDLRHAAVLAAGYAERRELAPMLERLSADDDDEVRGHAAGILAGLRRTWGETPS